jgi:uncharacterized protein YndB with AHSA1/START domain
MNWTITTPPVARAQMLIRRPVSEVFEAFVDPAIVTRFWFTRSSGRLEPGARVRWDWEMYGASAQVFVRALERDARILIEWDDPATEVEWSFSAREDGTTLVTITNAGFSGTGDEIVAKALDATGGFSFLLAAAKAYLEHGVQLNLVAGHAPEAHVGDSA